MSSFSGDVFTASIGNVCHNKCSVARTFAAMPDVCGVCVMGGVCVIGVCPSVCVAEPRGRQFG